MSKIFVGGLNYDTDRATLTEAFSTCGKILQVLILREPESGRSRGFCFIKFSSTREANNAIEKMNGVEIDGRTLKVDYCSDNKQTNDRNFSQDNRQASGNFFGSRDQAGGNFGNSFNRDSTNQSSERRYGDSTQDRFPQRNYGAENQRSYGNNSNDNHGSRSNFKTDFDSNSADSESSRANTKSEYDNIFGEIPKSQRDSSRSDHGSNYGGNRSSNGFSNAVQDSLDSNFGNTPRGSRNEHNSNIGRYQNQNDNNHRNTNYNHDFFQSSSRCQDKSFSNGENGQNYSKKDDSYVSRDNKTLDSQSNWFSAPPADQNFNNAHGAAPSNWD